MQDQQDAIIRKMLRESAEACFGNEWTPSGKRFGFGKRPLHQAVLTPISPLDLPCISAISPPYLRSTLHHGASVSR